VVRRSIAVLPFVNMSSDPEQEYFSDGLSEEILNLLAKVPDLMVIGRTSSFAFKGKNQDLRVIGKALGVATVLEGSVRKSGERVRITAQLIDVSNGAHLWSETYDRTLSDIFAVQDDVASEILGALQIHVGTAPTRGRPTENTDAYAQFLKAKAAMNRWDADIAEDFLVQAVELDPEFAEAWEMLAYAYWEQWGTTLDAASAQPLTFNAATRALAIDPDLVLAQVFLETADPEDSWFPREIEGLERVLREEPNNAVAAELLTWDLMAGGYFREALRLARHTAERDPLAANAQLNLHFALYASGHKNEALSALELADELGSIFSKIVLAFFHRNEQNYELSIAYEEAHMQERGLPDDWVRSMHVGASDPATGQAYLDRRIPEILATVPEDRAFEFEQLLYDWYLTYRFLDRYFELIFELGVSAHAWGDPETLIANGLLDRDSGFTAHPRFLEVAEKMAFFELWDQRGPPDFCEKIGGEWVCE
jgi:TolB-like protein